MHVEAVPDRDRKTFADGKLSFCFRKPKSLALCEWKVWRGGSPVHAASWSSDATTCVTIAPNRGRAGVAGVMAGACFVEHVIQTPLPGRVAQVGEAGASRSRCKAVAEPFGCYRVVPSTNRRRKG